VRNHDDVRACSRVIRIAFEMWSAPASILGHNNSVVHSDFLERREDLFHLVSLATVLRGGRMEHDEQKWAGTDRVPVRCLAC